MSAAKKVVDGRCSSIWHFLRWQVSDVFEYLQVGIRDQVVKRRRFKFAHFQAHAVGAAQQLIDALRVIDAEKISFEMNASNKPAMIKAASDFLYVLMPVDLS